MSNTVKGDWSRVKDTAQYRDEHARIFRKRTAEKQTHKQRPAGKRATSQPVAGELLPHEKEYWSHFVTHDASKCAGSHCPVHNPSNHTMRSWPLNYRTDRGITERICRCGVGHPDPDCQRAQKDPTHGCCGCCTNPNAE